MKTRILIALPLAAALALPVMAQSTSTNDQNAPAMQSQDQSQNPSTPAQDQAAKDQNSTQPSNLASGKQPLEYERHEGFWGKINPFARKKYVQRQLSPVRDRVNELDELTASNSKMIKDVDARATEGIRLASAKANEADQHAIDAGNKAQLAQQTATDASTHLQSVQQVVGSIDQYQPVTQAEIRFRPGQAVLSKKAKDALDEMATSLKDQKGYIVEVQGFSSGRGPAALENSQRMAESVVRYLVLNHDVPVYRIYTLGMGNAPVPASANQNGKARYTRGGRVEISLMKNGIDQLNQSASNSGAPAMGSQQQSMPQSDQAAQPNSNSNVSPATTTPNPAGQPAAQPNSNTPPQQNTPRQ